MCPQSRPNAFCDPKWHGGKETKASWILREEPGNMGDHRFACCNNHLSKAYDTMKQWGVELMTIRRA